jgi:hypothetical protein
MLRLPFSAVFFASIVNKMFQVETDKNGLNMRIRSSVLHFQILIFVLMKQKTLTPNN